MKCIFILSYFGTFPKYFPLYLESCRFNPEYEWLIITDNRTNYSYPKNVKVLHRTLSEVEHLIQSKFDFKIKCDKVYKLCDYKPAYGYIFEEYIKGYDFWGHVDCDCIWGNLNRFITPEVLSKYDRIYGLGHLSLFRNTPENNRMFMRTLNGKERYREVYGVMDIHKSFIFDECYAPGSIGDIYREYNIPVYEDHSCVDLHEISPCFEIIDYFPELRSFKRQPIRFMYFIWNKGNLKGVSFSNFKKKEQEYSYLHFHGKRNLNDKVGDQLLISTWKVWDDSSFHTLKVICAFCQYVASRLKLFLLKKIGNPYMYE